MAKQRCKDSSLDSFFGHFLYQQKVPRDHFLRKLGQVVDWGRFSRHLLKYYRGKGEVGQAPYSPALVLKMLLLSYLPRKCRSSRRFDGFQRDLVTESPQPPA